MMIQNDSGKGEKEEGERPHLLGVPGAWYVLTHLVLKTVLGKRYYFPFCVINEETETHTGVWISVIFHTY